MTIYYSPTTKGFYDTDIVEYPSLPDDIIEITAKDRDHFIEQVNNKGNDLVFADGELSMSQRKIVVTWESVRLERNSLLNASDYTQVPDFPGDKEAWAIYRQKLRDIPQQFANPEDVDWPVAPNN